MELALLLCLFLPVTAVQNYYVSAIDGSPCPPDVDCHDLSYYVNQSNKNIFSDAIFHFMNGTHHLSRSLFFQKVKNLKWLGYEGEFSVITIGSGIFVSFGQSITLSHIVLTTVPDHGSNKLLSFENVYNISLENVTVQNIDLITANATFVTIINSTFSQNSQIVINKSTLSLCNSLFSYSKKTFLSLYASTVTLCSNNHFIGNHGSNGGAVALYLASKLKFDNNSKTLFSSNVAEGFGGAIYVDDSLYMYATLGFSCFYETIGNPHVNFTGNTAGIAGSALYLKDTTLQGCSGFSKFFNFTDHLGYSVVSSNAQKACFCNNIGSPICGTSNTTLPEVIGKMVHISVGVVGEMNGLTLGTLQIIDSNSTTRQLAFSKECVTLNHMVKESDGSGQDALTISVVGDSDIPSSFLTVNVIPLPCPPGFQLSTDTGVCECTHNLAAVADCHVSNGTITKESNVWIYFDDKGNCTIIHSSCPYSYCKRASVTFSLTEPDTQCKSGRKGRVCGTCDHNNSLVFGSNDCKQCHGYSYLLLIIPFAFAGVALLSFIIILNLTVSVGSINGLLFYVNIVKLYEPILFPDGPVPFLSQFVAWFNLDVGLEFCFYEGMSACGKMWLQFVFPVYLLLLVVVLFISCRISKFMRGFFGEYLYPVLATVSVLVYTKVLRNIVLIMAITRLTCNEQTSIYWYLDPNVPYGGACHLPLMAIAVLILLLLIVPYIVFLLLFPLLQLNVLQRLKYIRLCRDKLKPITDAYGAPFYKKYQYWNGILALQRFVLALVVSFNGDSNLALRVLVIAMVKLIITLNFGQVYTSKLNRMLDTWFILSLMVTASFAINDANEWKLPIASKSVIVLILAIAFMIFFGLIMYYTFLRICRPLCQKIIRRRRYHFEESSDHDTLEDDVDDTPLQLSIND